MAAALTVAELLIGLGVDSKQAEKSAEDLGKKLDKTEKKGAKLGATLKTLGKGMAIFAGAVTVAAAGVFKLVDSMTSAADEVGKAAKQFGVGVVELQRLRFAADRSGASADTLSMALKNQARFIRDAQISGVTPFTEALDQVGLTLEELASATTAEKRFGLIGKALRGVADDAEKVALAQKLVGEESGPRLIPFLLEGTEGLAALGDEAERLGLVLDEGAIAKSEAFQDSVTNLKASLSGLKNTISLSLLPTVDKLIKRFTAFLGANKKIRDQKIDEFFKKVGQTLERLVPLFEAFGRALLFVVENLDVFIGLLIGAKLASGVGVFVKGMQSMGIAAGAALGPIGAIITALGILIPFAIRAGDALGDFLVMQAGGSDAARVVRKRKQAPGLGNKAAIAQSKIVREAENEIRDLNKQIKEGRGKRPSGGTLIPQTGLGGALVARRQAAIERRDAASLQLEELQAAPDFVAPEAIQVDIPTFDPSARNLIGGRGVSRGGKAAKDRQALSITSVQDLIDAAAGGELSEIASSTPSVTEIEPTVAVDITNNNFSFQIDQTISGVSDPVAAGNAAFRAFETQFTRKMSQAGQKLANNVRI